ncbi:MAG: glycosyltransferase family 1 protein [Acidobacteriota bacterium]
MLQGIKYISMNESSGYGIAAQRYIEALITAGINLTWAPMVAGRAWKLGYQPFSGSHTGNAKLDRYCNRSIEYDTVVIHTVPEYYPYWISREPNKRYIGYTVWETDIIPAHWKDLLNLVDQLIVPCHWNKTVFEQCGVIKPIDILPHLYESNEITGLTGLANINPEDYVFYTIGEWTNRKAIWYTVQAYCSAFTSQDRTLLVIKTTERDLTRKVLRLFYTSSKYALKRIISQYSSPPKICLITEALSHQNILNLHAIGNCYISLCRCEGWGLGAYDAARFAKPIIITAYGGQLDYLPPDLAFLVNYRLLPVVDELRKRSYSGDQHWAEPDLDQATKLMRAVYDNREAAEARGRELQKFILNRFDEKSILDKFIDILNKRDVY